MLILGFIRYTEAVKVIVFIGFALQSGMTGRLEGKVLSFSLIWASAGADRWEQK